MKKLLYCLLAFSLFLASCSSDCNQPQRDAFNFYLVDGSGTDIFKTDPSLNRDSVYLAVDKNGIEQPATRSLFAIDLVGSDSVSTFYNGNIPDLNVNSDTQTVYLYAPGGRTGTIQVVTFNEIDPKCGSVLRIQEVLQGASPVQKNSGYYRIVL